MVNKILEKYNSISIDELKSLPNFQVSKMKRTRQLEEDESELEGEYTVYVLENKPMCSVLLFEKNILPQNLLTEINGKNSLLVNIDLQEGIMFLYKYNFDKKSKSYIFNKRTKIVVLEKASLYIGKSLKASMTNISRLLFTNEQSIAGFMKNIDPDLRTILLLNSFKEPSYKNRIIRRLQMLKDEDENLEIDNVYEYLKQNEEIVTDLFLRRYPSYNFYDNEKEISETTKKTFINVFKGLLRQDTDVNIESNFKIYYGRPLKEVQEDNNKNYYGENSPRSNFYMDSKEFSKGFKTEDDLEKLIISISGDENIASYMIRGFSDRGTVNDIHSILKDLDRKTVESYINFIKIVKYVQGERYYAGTRFFELLADKTNKQYVENIAEFYDYLDDTYFHNSKFKNTFISKYAERYADYYIYLNGDDDSPKYPSFPRNIMKAMDEVFGIQRKIRRTRYNNDLGKDCYTEMGIFDKFTKFTKKEEWITNGSINIDMNIDEKYMIRLPRFIKEFAEEGINLRHCALVFYDIVLKKQSIVLFFRDRDQPDTSLYTIELDPEMTKVLQVSGKYDVPINPMTDREAAVSMIKFFKKYELDYSRIKSLNNLEV